MVRADRRVSTARVILFAAGVVAVVLVIARLTRGTGTAALTGSEVLMVGVAVAWGLGLLALAAIGVLAIHRWLQRRGRSRMP